MTTMTIKHIATGLTAIALLAANTTFAGITADKPTPARKAAPTTYKVDAAKSVLNWEGKKVTGQHNGTVLLKDGMLTVEGGKLTGGMFTIDMASMTDLDLTDKGYNEKLMGHLKSPDFFDVAKHPTAVFKITSVKPGAAANQYTIAGSMTIKGITNAVSFPATVKMSGNMIEADGKATLDRTKYDIRYGSKSFFENIGDKAIYDEFVVDLKLVATK
jgi:polyisoprenoid-binding protein YceI